MSALLAQRSTWASRLGLLGCVTAMVAFPVVLYRLAGGMPSLPRLASWSAVQAFARSSDDVAFARTVLRDGERFAWVLWFYLALSMVMEALGRVFEGRGHPWLRRAWQRFQPASAVAAANLLITLALASFPRMPQGAVAAAATVPVASLHSMPAGGADGAAQRPQVLLSAGDREHVVREGESLWVIAAAVCGSPLHWRDIADLNGLADPSRIYPGTRLRLPAECESSEYRLYVVEPRDSLTRIAQREYGTATAAVAIWEANRGRTMADGRTFADPNRIYPDWTLRLPTDAGSAVLLAGAPPAQVGVPDSAPEVVPPNLPEAAPTAVPSPAASPGGAGDPPPSGISSPSPAGPVSAGRGVTREADPPLVRARRRLAAGPADVPGVTVPGGVLPYGVASGLLAAVLLARLRRRSRLPLGSREPRRPDGPMVRAIRQSDSPPVMDALTPHTEALLGRYRAVGRPMPRVLAAWDSGEAVQLLLETDPGLLPPDGVDEVTGIRVGFGLWEGLAVAVATGERAPSLRRDSVPFVDDLLVPVGGEAQGWLHLPLLREPLAVVGPGADALVESILVAAALRAGGDDDLRIVISDGAPIRPRLPQGIDLPRFERMPAKAIADALAGELERRPRVLHANSCETFAELAGESPGYMPGWVVVLGPEDVASCAGDLRRLARMGIGAVVLGDVPEATRWVRWEADGVSVSAPELGTFHNLMPFVLPEGLVDELEAEASPVEVIDLASEEARSSLDAEEVVVPATVEPAIRIHLFGGYRLERNGVEVPLSDTTSAQARELLAYLAVAAEDGNVADGWIPATRLREVLWPGAHDAADTQIKPLHRVVSKARHWAEGDARLEDPIIEHGAGRYRLTNVWIDLAEFRGLVRRGSPADLEAALRLYRGDLLDGQDAGQRFHWVRLDGYRDEERARYNGAAGRLAESLLEAGHPDQALAILEPVLRGRDGAVEALVRLAMRCEAARGNYEGMRERYGRLEEALDREPSGETADLLACLFGEASSTVARSG